MARIVGNNDHVAHVWAHSYDHTDSQTDAHSGNMRCQNGNIYSYGERIGQLTRNDSGSVAAILSTRRWSNTTSGHQSDARRAVSHLPRFYVNEIMGNVTRQRDAMATTIQEQIKNAPVHRLAKMRLRQWDEAMSYVDTCNEFCRFFGLPEFVKPTIGPDVEAEMTKLRDAILKSEAEAEAKRAKERAKAERKARKEYVIALASWKTGGPRVYGCHLDPYSYMRLSADGTMIETTQGAEVPVDHVRRIAPFVLAKIDETIASGVDYERDWKAPVRVGHFQIDRIGPDGIVTVGCHRFERSEVERIALLIGATVRDRDVARQIENSARIGESVA